MPFQIIRNDITKVHADAIVNTANPEPIIGGGTDRAIYDAAGEKELLSERQKIGKIMPGNIAVTPAFNLPAKYIFHSSGPIWVDGTKGEFDILRICYEKCLNEALELGCESIAFPLMATGTYGFPRAKALSIAMNAISSFCLEHDLDVYLVVFSRESFELSGKIFGDVKAFVDENYVSEAIDAEYEGEGSIYERRVRARKSFDSLLNNETCECEAIDDKTDNKKSQNNNTASETVKDPATESLLKLLTGKKLKDLVGNNDIKGFRDKLFELIDKRGFKDSEVYRRANVTKQTFSKIRNNPDYRPAKSTALAFAFSLKLDLYETTDLLQRAGHNLTRLSAYDLAIAYFIVNGYYDIDRVNAYIFDRELGPTLGQQ